MGSSGRTIPESLVAYLESGVSVMVGTRNRELRPTAMRAAGARVHADGRTLDVYLPLVTADRAIADVRESGRAAISFSRPIDHLSVQLKGRARVREGGEPDRAAVSAYLSAFAEQLELVGLPRVLVERLTIWPAAVLEVEVESLFTQTPGPTAGTALGASR